MNEGINFSLFHFSFRNAFRVEKLLESFSYIPQIGEKIGKEVKAVFVVEIPNKKLNKLAKSVVLSRPPSEGKRPRDELYVL